MPEKSLTTAYPEMTIMKTNPLKTTLYWLSTGLLGLDFLLGGAFQMAR